MSDPFTPSTTPNQPIPPTQFSPETAPPVPPFNVNMPPPVDPSFSVYAPTPGTGYQANAPAPGVPPQQPWGAAAGPVDPASQRTFAILIHVLGLFTYFIAPLIFYIMYKDRDAYLREHARQALNWQITRTIGVTIGWILTVILIGPIIVGVIEIANIVFCILAAMKANQGQYYKYPISFNFVKN